MTFTTAQGLGSTVVLRLRGLAARVLVLVLVVGLSLLVPIRGAGAVVPVGSDSDGLIVFVSNRDGNDEIYTTEPDGSNQRNLTMNPAGDRDPRWSPDGASIVFVSDRDGSEDDRDVFVMAADGSHPVNLTVGPGDDWGPRWSPDGTMILFSSDRGGDTAIYVMDPDGSNLRRLVLRDDSETARVPSWSPDGRSVAFRLDCQIHAIDVDTGVRRQVTDRSPVRNPLGDALLSVCDSYPKWSPDGSRIAFVRHYRHRFDPRGSRGVLLLTDAAEFGSVTEILSAEHYWHPSVEWSPDAHSLAVVTEDVYWSRSLTVTSVSNGSHSSVRILVQAPEPDSPIHVADVQWSPDGSQLVVTGDETPQYSLRHRSLYVVAPDGSDPVNLSPVAFADDSPVWQPPDPDREAVVTLLGGLSAVGPGVQVEALQVTGTVANRWSGLDRYATAVAISSKNAVPGVPVVYVVTGEDFPDALAVAPLAAAADSPVLLSRTDTIPAVTRTELDRLQPARIVVVGGPNAVSDTVIDQLARYTIGTVTRLAGPDRFATAVAISTAGFPDGADTVVLATGIDYPDAVSGAAAAATLGIPILLSDHTNIPPVVMDELARLNPTRIVVIGGPAALDTTIETQLATAGFDNATRIAGTNRYTTSVAVTQWVHPGGNDRLLLATGTDFPDALTGAAIAGGNQIPILLTTPTDIPNPTANEINRLLNP